MRKKITALMLALSMLLALTACGESERVEENTAPAGLAVQVTEAKVQTLSSDVTVSGKVAAEAETAVYVLGSNSATVAEVYVSEGDRVTAGDVLCRLDTSRVSGSDLSNQASYLASMENYNTQKALLDRTVSMQQTNYENTLALYEIGAASRLEVDAAELQYLSAIAQRDATLSQLASAMSSQQSGYLQMNAAMQGADANGNVIAPVSGTVTSVSATVGSTVSATKPIAVIDAAGQMNISVSVSEALLPKLAVGDMASVSVSSLSLEFDALITAIDRASSLQTQLYGVTLSVPEEIEGLRPGTFADVSFHTDTSLDTVVVPTEAILTAAGEQYVYVVDGTVARKAPVTVGLAGSGVTELLSGVSAGESVVTVGQQYLSDGDAVRIVEGAK
ncbi:MAG: efflux RND transporter periplasmic adaptor subunit [Oscillospiraceae bacterium]|nr:efflux RND transporter periplasmic adaptor subunit [Oscillospiraceae bacterium]